MGILDNNIRPPSRGNISNPIVIKSNGLGQGARSDKQVKVSKHDPYHNFRRRLRKDIF